MAKRRNNKSKKTRTRVTNRNTSRPRLRSYNLNEIQDDRTFNFGQSPIAKTTRRKPARVRVSKTTKPVKPQTYPNPFIGFENPMKVITCVRRGVRKEVLHARKKTGLIGQKKPKRTAYSNIHC